MLRVEGLCLGIHGTWRAEGADTGEEAVGSVSRRKEPVLERRENQEERCLVGNFSKCGEEEVTGW